MTKQADTRETPALSPETITMHLTMCASNSTVESLVQRWAVHTKSAEYPKTVKEDLMQHNEKKND